MSALSTAARAIPPLVHDRAFLALAGLLLLLAVAGDTLTTHAALGRGGVELDPFAALVLARWSWPGLVLWKLALVCGWLAWSAIARALGPFGRRVALSATALFCALYAWICLANLGLLPQLLYGLTSSAP